jgi:pyruvate-ferredoxin/flavodoxin oxidoreductase
MIIAYCPCINHGIYAGMGCSQQREKEAVEAGYWHLYRHNPELAKEGKNPFILDSKEPKASFKDFLMGEVRYASLTKTFPDIAKDLFNKAEQAARERYEKYRSMAEGGKA